MDKLTARKSFLNTRRGLTIGQIIDELIEFRRPGDKWDPFDGLSIGQVVDFITRYRLLLI